MKEHHRTPSAKRMIADLSDDEAALLMAELLSAALQRTISITDEDGKVVAVVPYPRVLHS